MLRIRRRLAAAFVVLLVLSAWVTALPAGAAPPLQEDNVIAYGEVKSGEITDRAFEQEWTFEGEAGDIVGISVKCDGFSGYVIMLDSEAEVIAEIDAFTAFDYQVSQFYVMELPADGAYTVIVTRQGGRTGTGTGSYELQLDEATPLVWGVPATLTFDPKEHAVVYSVFRTDAAQEIQLDYSVVSGEFRPEVTVVQPIINDRGTAELKKLCTAYGEFLTAGKLMVALPEEGLYVITIDPAWGSTSPQAASAYEVTISPAE